MAEIQHRLPPDELDDDAVAGKMGFLEHLDEEPGTRGGPRSLNLSAGARPSDLPVCRAEPNRSC